MKFFASLVFISICLPAAFSQQDSTQPNADEKERQELGQALAEAGTSPVDFLRALERHLDKYPNSKQRPQIERAAVKAAIEAKDNQRIILYGEKVLATTKEQDGKPDDGKHDDMEVLDHVVRALLASDGPENAKRALPLAQRYEKDYERLRPHPVGHYSAAQWAEQMDRGIARACALEARAAGNLGNLDEAVRLAQKSWATYPTGEGAREAGRWLAKQGKNVEAVQSYANAFTIEDPQSTDIERGRDRIHMGELYSKANGSEKGLGDLILQAYDHTSALLNERTARLKTKDPNANASNILDFTLPALDGSKLALGSLKGKTVVIDFWATWCGPCRVQHPLIETVKQEFASNGNVVFLSVNADEDRSVVAPFLKDIGWKGGVYFESGLSSLLRISSIPTVIIVDPSGQISSRMTGFIPERFTEMLAQRIREASQAQGPAAPKAE